MRYALIPLLGLLSSDAFAVTAIPPPPVPELYAPSGWELDARTNSLARKRDVPAGHFKTVMSDGRVAWSRVNAVSGNVGTRAFTVPVTEHIVASSVSTSRFATALIFAARVSRFSLPTLILGLLVEYGVRKCFEPGGWCSSQSKIGLEDLGPSSDWVAYDYASGTMKSCAEVNGHLFKQGQIFVVEKGASSGAFVYPNGNTSGGVCRLRWGAELVESNLQPLPLTEGRLTTAIERGLEEGGAKKRLDVANAMEAEGYAPWNEEDGISTVTADPFALPDVVENYRVTRADGSVSQITRTVSDVVTVTAEKGEISSVKLNVNVKRTISEVEKSADTGQIIRNDQTVQNLSPEKSSSSSGSHSTLSSGGSSSGGFSGVGNSPVKPLPSPSKTQSSQSQSQSEVPRGPSSSSNMTEQQTNPERRSPKEGESVTECDKRPNLASCKEFGDVPSLELPTSTINVNLSPLPSFLGEGSCPADRTTALRSGGVIAFSYRPACEFMTSLKPVILAMASFVAVLIFTGAVRRD